MATQAWAGTAPAAKQDRCHGVAVTITENKKGDPLSNHDDLVLGTNHRDVVNLLGGDDRIYGDDGNDLVCGGQGEDLLLGGDDDDKLYGDGGDDFSRGIKRAG